MSIYQEEGYKNRKDYLKSMSEEYGVPFDITCMIASMLGPNEDFDGLLCELEDYADGVSGF